MKKICKVFLLGFLSLFTIFLCYAFYGIICLFNLFEIKDSNFSFTCGFEKEYELNRYVNCFDVAIEIKDINNKNIKTTQIIDVFLFNKENECFAVYTMDDFSKVLKYTENTVTVSNSSQVKLDKDKYIKYVKIVVLQQDERIKTGRDILFISNMIVP